MDLWEGTRGVVSQAVLGNSKFLVQRYQLRLYNSDICVFLRTKGKEKAIYFSLQRKDKCMNNGSECNPVGFSLACPLYTNLRFGCLLRN